MKRKRKKKRSIEELLGPAYLESHDRTQRLLAARLADVERKIAEERGRGGEPAGR